MVEVVKVVAGFCGHDVISMFRFMSLKSIRFLVKLSKKPITIAAEIVEEEGTGIAIWPLAGRGSKR